MRRLGGDLMRHSRAVHSYLETKSGIGVAILDRVLDIRDCNSGFVRLLSLAEKPLRRPVTDFVALEIATPPAEAILSFSKRTGLSGYLRCTFTPADEGWIFFCERLTLPESQVIDRMGQLHSELLVMQREVVQKNLMLEKLNGELKESREQLQAQHEKLQESFRALEEESAARLQAAEAARESEQMLIQQNRMAAVGEMLSNLAHQWRQPLNVLGLKIQALKVSADVSRELLANTVDGAMNILNQLSHSIEALMAVSVPDREKSSFRVEGAVRQAAALVDETLKTHGIALVVDPSADARINGYRNEYIQVLITILVNAKDALEERDIEGPKITVRIFSERGKSVVTIADNAGGVEEGIIGKIFDAYFTTKPLGKGTGINLFLSKIIIEKKMGGRVMVRNTGDGTEFRVEV